MDEEKTIKQFYELSDSAKKEASNFISYLHKKYKPKSLKGNGKKESFKKIKFYGIYKNKKDMKDSTEWVREVRKKNWGSK